MTQKEFTPGAWLEIRNNLRLEAGRSSIPFMVRLDMEFANGTFFRSTIEAESLEDLSRIYLSPASLRRLTGSESPSTDAVVWVALTDLTGGARSGAGSPSGDAPDEVPFHGTIRALGFGETPFEEYEREQLAGALSR